MKQVRIGIVGLTGRGKLAGLWHDPNGNSVVVAGMDSSDEAVEMFKKEIKPDASTTKNYDEFLGMDGVDAVAVMSPDFTHEEYVIKAFEAGKHVFCEKPMAITTEGCDRMLRAWKASGKYFMIGFNMRYMNVFRVMKDIVDSGIIGHIRLVWVRHFVSKGGDWYYHDWHASSKNSTGLLLQKASHDFDMIHWITGKYTRRVVAMGSLDYYGGDKPNTLRCPDCPEKEECVEFQHIDRKANKMDLCVFRKEVDVEDSSTVIMELEGGVKATYMQCHYTPDSWRNYTFVGTEGRIELLDGHSKVVVKTRTRSRRWKNLAEQTYDIKPAEGGHEGADPLVCRDFVDMILKGGKTLAPPLAGRMSVATACAATYSIRNRSKVVDVPLVPKELQS